MLSGVAFALRAITGIRENTTYQQRNQPEREAVNMEIQGSAADLIKLAMLNLFRRLKREGLRSRMLLQIHDELVFECPPDELPKLTALVREEMTTPVERLSNAPPSPAHPALMAKAITLVRATWIPASRSAFSTARSTG